MKICSLSGQIKHSEYVLFAQINSLKYLRLFCYNELGLFTLGCHAYRLHARFEK